MSSSWTTLLSLSCPPILGTSLFHNPISIFSCFSGYLSSRILKGCLLNTTQLFWILVLAFKKAAASPPSSTVRNHFFKRSSVADNPHFGDNLIVGNLHQTCLMKCLSKVCSSGERKIWLLWSLGEYSELFDIVLCLSLYSERFTFLSLIRHFLYSNKRHSCCRLAGFVPDILGFLLTFTFLVSQFYKAAKVCLLLLEPS